MSSTTSQGYADLSADGYIDRNMGVRKPNERETLIAGGVEYRVLEHANNPRTGYQGTIYQRMDNGEIVVSHRGTEFDKLRSDPVAFARDVVEADGGMVALRANQQAPDAIELTRRAIKFAEVYGDAPGHHYVKPTVTGHSLGGTLGQITAHHFGLQGETFNAYGAGSLNFRMGNGHGQVLNHVMAGDLVSSASQHYGDIVVYSKPQEIASLLQHGAGQSRAQSTVAGALLIADSHRLYNFLSQKDGQPNLSALEDPSASILAKDNASMIAAYRNDLGQMREAISVISAVAGSPSAKWQGVEHLVGEVRGPLQPGEPARQEQDAYRPPTPTWMEERFEKLDQAQWRTPLRAAAGPSKEDAGLYGQLASGVARLGFPGAADFSADGPGTRLAADLLRQCRQDGISCADQVLIGKGDSPNVFAVQGMASDSAQNQRTSVDLGVALQRPADTSFEQAHQLGQQHTLQQNFAPQIQPEQSGPILSR